MKVLVTGYKGQLGFDVVKALTKHGDIPVAVDIEEMDITDAEAVESYVSCSAVEAVIHCAAYTAVDAAEDNVELCRRINRDGTQNIADACKKHNLKMLYISTDYVFGGDGETPYEISDEKAPQNIYGKSKLLGEDSVIALLRNYFIVRISWVFGAGGKNFVKTMLNFDKRRKKISVVDDQIGSPTYTADLAPLLVDMINSDKYGIYHATNEGFCSWAELAEEIFKQAGREITVEKIPTSDYPTPAKRPFNSRLSKSSLDEAGFNRLPSWQDAVTRFLTEIGGIKNAGNRK
mgnify:CR=1 FL=1